jgi:hypothetical protein
MAAGVAAGMVTVVIAVLVLLFIYRRRGGWHMANRNDIMQLELLVTEKVASMFALAFLGRSGPVAIAEASSAFAALEIPRKAVKIERLVGQGQFGDVHFGRIVWPARHPQYIANSGAHGVAVKSLREVELQKGAQLTDLAGEEALQLEARLLHQLRHPHIVQVLAVVTKSLPTLICIEYMQNGDLKNYLRFDFFYKRYGSFS